jgi:hypothetical protein
MNAINNCTVYLKDKVAPGGTDWHQGTMVRRDTTGVTMSGRGLNGNSFYPWSIVQRIDSKA